MKDVMLFSLFATFLALLPSVSSIAEEEGFSVEEHLKLERNHNKQNNPTTIWKFQISAPTDRDVYIPSFFWYSARPYMDSTLPPVFGNQIYIKKDKDIEE